MFEKSPKKVSFEFSIFFKYLNLNKVNLGFQENYTKSSFYTLYLLTLNRGSTVYLCIRLNVARFASNVKK